MINSGFLCIKQPDRRQQDIPVAIERRSGNDRRKTPRITDQINRDIYAPFIKSETIDATALSCIPPVDKIEEIQDCVKAKNYSKAIGITLLLANSFKKDIGELKGTKKEILNIFRTKKLLYEDHQTPHSFTQGTFIEKLDKRNILNKIDKTLFNTKISNFILMKLGKQNIHDQQTGLKDKFNEPIYKIKILGTKSAEIMGRILLRIPVLGVFTMFLLDLPQVIKVKNHVKQFVKSTINISLITIGGAFLGAIGAYYPPFGLIGAGLGALLGNKLAKKINDKL